MRTFLVIITALTTCLAFLSPASAHDYWSDRGEYVNYGDWQRPDGKGGCCNTTDCEPIDPSRYRTDRGGYEILIDGKWVKVKPEAYLDGDTMSEVAHACWASSWVMDMYTMKTRKVNPENPKIHCFKRPMGVARLRPPPAEVFRAQHARYH